ncbi:hypothetical protein BDW72DRAFT_192158 [Aspergillus terricola var. indicus]
MSLDEHCDHLEEANDDNDDDNDDQTMARKDVSEQRFLEVTQIIRDAVGNFDKALNATTTKNLRRAPIEYGERQVLLAALYQHAGHFRQTGILHEPSEIEVTGGATVSPLSRQATELADAHTLAHAAYAPGTQEWVSRHSMGCRIVIIQPAEGKQGG